MKLFEQYQRMYDHYLGQPVQPGMAQLAALLGSGERNVRLQLGKMQARGWLNWQVARGRGHHSTLSFLKAPQTLRLARLQQLIEQGEMEHAFASLADNQRQALMARLPALLGARPMSRELRVALYRAPASLDPAHVSSRLESHLVRQVFDRLCGYDSQQQRLVPALAHYWEADDTARRWRFWLRPDVRFHDGSPLQAEAVAASVIRLRDEANPFQRQYRHLSAIEVHGPL
jgi:SgrR family transcriptional regulator